MSSWKTYRFSLPLLASSVCAHAATLTCASLATAMSRSHIPDAAVAVFAGRHVQSIFCSSSAQSLSPDAVFEAASLTKPVFALGVLSLAQNGRLDLDRPLSAYLDQPYQHHQNPSGAGATDIVLDPLFATITARMVLSHTSGLPNWSHRKVLSLQSTPGKRWSYSGEGYVYLQHVLEVITHQPIDVFLHQEVLKPLGMTSSSFVWQPAFTSVALAGHSTLGAAEPIEQYTKPLASSTLYTTLGDYSRFITAMLYPTQAFPITVEEQRQLTVEPSLRLAWGLGVAIESTATPSYFHWGANPGFQSFFMCQPKTGRAILFLTDSDNGLDLVDTLVRASIPGCHPALKFRMLHPKD